MIVLAWAMTGGNLFEQEAGTNASAKANKTWAFWIGRFPGKYK